MQVVLAWQRRCSEQQAELDSLESRHVALQLQLESRLPKFGSLRRLCKRRKGRSPKTLP